MENKLKNTTSNLLNLDIRNIKSLTSANIISTDIGRENILRVINGIRSKNKKYPNVRLLSTKIISTTNNSIYKGIPESDRMLLKILLRGGKKRQINGNASFQEMGLSVQFPYMTPNNNSLFSAEMFKVTFLGPECAIKK